MKFFGNKSRRSRRSPASQNKRLAFEPMEARQMMTIVPITGIITETNPVAILPPAGPFAEGTINFNASRGELDIDGSQTHDNSIQIYINHRAGNGAGNLPDLLTVQLGNINSPQVSAFDPTQVKKIVVTCHDGNDFVDNRTAIAMIAYGGNGNDILLGGQGADFLYGGGGDDYIDGRTGDDMIWGEGGNDALFGDDGYDTILGGDGNDYLFGGRGADHLYGEGGNDVLYGEQGVDYLNDAVGTNRLITDFGTLPARIPGVNGLNQYYVFDKNFLDPTVRSMTRLDYFQGGSITHDDMMQIYSVISTDGVESAIPYKGTVSASELNDLKQIVSNNWPLSMDSVTKYFASRIALGDPANGHYQGAALGNLAAGATSDHLTRLIDKWFHGTDVPSLTGFTDAHYFDGNVMGGHLFVLGGPRFYDVSQGKTGDCYFLAALGEVAKVSPSTVQNMFTDNGDGTWVVKFYRGSTPVYVTVNDVLPTESNGTAYFADWGGGYFDSYSNILWVALAEKAYCQLNESGWTGQDGTNSYKGIAGGYAADAFYQITGHPASDTDVTSYLGIVDSQDDFASAFNHGKAIVLASKGDDTNSFIVHSHGYMVVGYDAVKKQYELYNPWGLNADATHPDTVWETWPAIRHDFDYWTSVTV
jgi:hypothetical protein